MLNPDSWTGGKEIIQLFARERGPKVLPDVFCVQEANLPDAEKIYAARCWGQTAGYDAFFSRAVKIGDVAAAVSSGTAVLAKQVHGLKACEVDRGRFEDRICLAWLFTGEIKILVLSLYCKDGVGLNAFNADLLQMVGKIVLHARCPWMVCGDFNMQPCKLEESEWLKLVKGVIVQPASPTCSSAGTTFDYVVVSRSLEPFVIEAKVVHDAPLWPHAPVAIRFRNLAKQHRIQTPVKAAQFPAKLPIGCENRPPEVNLSWVPGQEPAELDAAIAEWFGEAEKR